MPGITFNATATIPSNVLHSPSAVKIKFKQLVNVYRVRRTARGTQCFTFRPSASDTENPLGWKVDSENVYDRERGVRDFSNSFTASISTVDSPGNTLQIPLQYDYLYMDDRFEMYVNYVVGDEYYPVFERPLGKIAWSAGGEVFYNSANGVYSYTAAHPNPSSPSSSLTSQERLSTGILDTQFITDEQAYRNCPSGSPTPTPTPTPPGGGGAGNVSTFVSQSAPTSMEAGGIYPVSVTMRNNGTTTWTNTDGNGYKLGSQNPQDNTLWTGGTRVYLPSNVSVLPGAEYTFNFNVTAPYATGTYNFQWRMIQEGVQWFGDFTPNLLIEVYSLQSCDPWQEQDCYYNGGSWNPDTCMCDYWNQY